MKKQPYELAIEELAAKFQNIPMEILRPAFEIRNMEEIYDKN